MSPLSFSFGHSTGGIAKGKCRSRCKRDVSCASHLWQTSRSHLQAAASDHAMTGAMSGLGLLIADGGAQIPFPSPKDPQDIPQRGSVSLLYVLLPLLIVLSTLLFLVLVFLIALVWVRRRRGIRLVEEGGPLDLTRNDGVIGEGGIAGVEQRWLEQVSPEVAEGYRRGKGEETATAV